MRENLAQRSRHVIVTFVSVFTLKRPKGASAAKAGGILMMKILNKCIPTILVYNLLLDRHRYISIHWYIGCLHKKEIQIKKTTAI